MDPLVCFKSTCTITWQRFCLSRDIYIYLESACYGKQNGGQNFNLRARIAELWRFKARKVDKLEEDDRLSLVYGERVFWMRQ